MSEVSFDDKFKLNLEENIKKLQQCQKENNLNSCLKCEKLLMCPTRKNYVKAVYESMNKGEQGGFEF